MEGDLHRQLKLAACLWLWEHGYASIAEEVPVPGVGVVECKAVRADFLRDQGRQRQFAFAVRERVGRTRARRPVRPRHASRALGKFDTCIIRPHANLHYVLSPPGLLRVRELPRRWGLLVCDAGRIRVVRTPSWQEVADVDGIEGAIARALTGRYIRPTAGRPWEPQASLRSPTPVATLSP